MAFSNTILPHYTYDDYRLWKGRWELIDGIPYAMSSVPRPEHQAVAGNLHAEFRAAIKKVNCNCTVYQPIDYKITEDTVLNPDVLIVCQPITKQYLDFAPHLVAEVLSPSTALKDRHTKFEIYKQQGILYYLLLDVDQKKLEVFSLTEGKYKFVERGKGESYTFVFDDCTIAPILENIWS